MAVISVVKLSELDDTKRIDAEYYKPEFIYFEKCILQTNYCILWKNINGKFITGPFGSEFKVENYVKDSPYRYVRGRDVKEFFLLDDENVYIPKKDFERLRKYALEEGDILISVVGTLGNTAIVDKNVPPAIFSCKSTVFRTKSINPFYLIAYLNCKFGKALLQRKVRGAVQTGLNIDDLKSLPIFLPKREVQDDIAKIVLEAKEKYDDSKSLYSQAENLFLEELGLKDFKLEYKKTYYSNLAKTSAFHRMDAEYYQPIYDEVIDHIKSNFDVLSLGKLVFYMVKGIEVGSENYQENGKPFIRVSNVSPHGFVERDQKYISEELYKKLKDDYEPKVGELLLTKDATPGIAYVLKEPIEGIIASGILRLGVNESMVNKEYLALCINSLLGKLQIERDGGGSVITHWKPEQIRKMIVPILPDSTQRQISDLVRKSHEARKRAKELLEEAKRKVEEAIENEIKS